MQFSVGAEPDVVAALSAFEIDGDLARLDGPTIRLRALRSAQRVPTPITSVQAASLAGLLLIRGQRERGVAYLNEAIEVAREALEQHARGPVEEASIGVVLCTALMERFGRRGNERDLQEVLDRTQAHRNASTPEVVDVSLSNIRCSALIRRFDTSHDRAQLDDAIAISRANLLRRPQAGLLAAVTSNLAVCLAALYAQTADEDALREALTLTADAMSTLLSQRRGGLDPLIVRATYTRAFLLMLRWRFHNDREDLVEATEILDSLVARTDSATPDRAAILFAAASLQDDVAVEQRDVVGLDRAISLYERSMQLQSRETLLYDVISTNYAIARATRYELVGDVDDIEAAITIQRRVARRLGGSALRPTMDHNLAVLTAAYYDVTGDLAELDAALDHHERAVATVAPGAADRDIVLMRCAVTHLRRHDELAESSDLSRAIELLSSVARRAGVTVARIQATRLLAEAAFKSRDWELCVGAADLALTAVESVLGAVDVSRWDDWLVRTQGVAALGGYAAARQGDLGHSLEIVERGCGVVAAGRLNQQRAMLHQAKADGHEAEASRYEDAAERARLMIATQSSGSDLIRPGVDHRDDLPEALAGLDSARRALVTVVPTMRPSADVSELLAFVAATGEPLTYVLSTPAGGATLTVVPLEPAAKSTSGKPEIRVGWLADLDSAAVDALADRIHRPSDTGDSGGWNRGIRGRGRGPDGEEVAAVVAELADQLGDGSWRVGGRLVPVGKLGMLPISAAWQSVDGRSMPIGVAGSGRLHLAAHQNAVARSARGIAAITNPAPCHWLGQALPELPSATDEGEYLAHEFGAVLRDGIAATYKALIEFLNDERIGTLHVAAHGWTSPYDPDAVRLLLADGVDGIAEALAMDDLPPHLHCATVFLACCWLARTSEKLPDESAGFATTLLQAGAARVIAPLWPVDDYGAFQIATAYYRHLLVERVDARVALSRARDEVKRRSIMDPRLKPRERLELRAAADAFVLNGA